MPDDSTLRIRDILDPKRVQLHVAGNGKREILTALVAPIAATHASIDSRALVETLLRREQTSTRRSPTASPSSWAPLGRRQGRLRVRP
jgi:hypothetical protein